MATAAKKKDLDVKAIQKMLKLFKQRRDEDAALIDELERLLGGGPGIGEILKELYETWNELWSHTHGGSYMFVFAEDTPQMKRLFRGLGQEELTARFFNYMRDRDDWLMKAKHPFKVFVKQNNRYASARTVHDDVDAAPTGCKHSPPCRSDQEHTKRVNQEVRA